ncbi:MAG: DUF2334 domain-containing protein, partial [bacterium]
MLPAMSPRAASGQPQAGGENPRGLGRPQLAAVANDHLGCQQSGAKQVIAHLFHRRAAGIRQWPGRVFRFRFAFSVLYQVEIHKTAFLQSNEPLVLYYCPLACLLCYNCIAFFVSFPRRAAPGANEKTGCGDDSPTETVERVGLGMKRGNPGIRRSTLMRIVVSLLLLAALVPGAQAATRVLVLFDGRQDPSGEGYLNAHYIANLLGHFETQWELRHLDHYRRGDAHRYDAVFFASTVTRPRFPAGFLEDAASTRRTFVWLGRHIGELLAGGRSEQFGFSYIDYRDDEDFDTVIYRNIRLPKGYPDLNLVAVLAGAPVRVHAIAQNSDKVVYPYVLQRGSFWYFADSPFSFANEGDRYLVFCDLLHDILGQPHAGSRRAMVRIEDVSVDQDPKDLRAIADYLYSQGIPFQVALIPIFRDPQRGLEVHLSDRRPFVEAVRYMMARGGSIVLHGVTHQYRGASGDDFEFWNDLAEKPVPNDGQRDALERKLELAFRECFRNGIYPIAWETPHNAASPNTYTFLKDYFTVFHERVLAAPTRASEQYFPYPVRDRYGRFVVPENLGFLPEGATDTAPLVEHARAMLAVRDGIATFYFHPFLKLEHLKQIVGGIRGLGYEFVSLRDFG